MTEEELRIIDKYKICSDETYQKQVARLHCLENKSMYETTHRDLNDVHLLRAIINVWESKPKVEKPMTEEVHNDWCDPETQGKDNLQKQIDDINKKLDIVLIAVGLVEKVGGLRSTGLSPGDPDYQEIRFDKETMSKLEWKHYVESLKKECK